MRYKLIERFFGKVKLILERLFIAQSRQESYEDRKVHDMEFMLDDQVLLKVSHMKGVIWFGKKGKLSPRYTEYSSCI